MTRYFPYTYRVWYGGIIQSQFENFDKDVYGIGDQYAIKVGVKTVKDVEFSDYTIDLVLE